MRTWKLVFSVLAMSFCGVANGQSCGGDEIYNETFYIDKQIDSVRYVDRVVARDNEEGDFILDFMVERSDTSTRERWMVTYVCDASYHMVQEVRVAGALQSTLRLAGALSTPRVSLFSPTTGLDPEVQADVPCEDVDLPSLRANIALTSIARLVALEVTTAVVDQMPAQPTLPQPGPAGFAACVAGCPTPPALCTPPPTDCLQKAICDLAVCAQWTCLHTCNCNHHFPPYTPQQVQLCLDQVQWFRIRCFNKEFQDLLDCLETIGCE
ncbi:MAG: hypothetical protein L0Y42_08005 [Phycisphaerales bacterium]|nr:hypothetical protein [Phycisphaerales bacterium]